MFLTVKSIEAFQLNGELIMSSDIHAFVWNSSLKYDFLFKILFSQGLNKYIFIVKKNIYIILDIENKHLAKTCDKVY